MNDKLLILGVTGSGKGRAAFELAKELDGEIISIDSMKVYRRMDIGTAKPPRQVREQVRYHLIDVIEPSESFSVGRFVELAQEAMEEIRGRGKRTIAVGGTALYIKALLYGLFEGPGADEEIRDELRRRAERDGLEGLYRELAEVDPAAARRINGRDARRIIRGLEVYRLTGKPISSFQRQFETTEPLEGWRIIGLRRDKAVERRRINARVKGMIEAGLVDEVRGLLAEAKPLSIQARCAIGYAEIIDYLDGEISLEEAVELIKKNTRRFAKGQRTWFKRFEGVRWVDIEEEESTEEILGRVKQVVG
jgi:tRNA dimethylallyltransferase